MLIDTDTQQYEAASQQLLRAGHRRRYAARLLTYHNWYRHNTTCGRLRNIGA
jgi:hypothetical protein